MCATMLKSCHGLATQSLKITSWRSISTFFLLEYLKISQFPSCHGRIVSPWLISTSKLNSTLVLCSVLLSHPLIYPIFSNRSAYKTWTFLLTPPSSCLSCRRSLTIRTVNLPNCAIKLHCILELLLKWHWTLLVNGEWGKKHLCIRLRGLTQESDCYQLSLWSFQFFSCYMLLRLC